MEPIDVVVNGALGRMGRAVCAAVAADAALRLSGGADPAVGAQPEVPGLPFCEPSLEAALARAAEGTGTLGATRVVVEFTEPSAVVGNVLTCVDNGWAAVVGTTGLSAEDVARLAAHAQEHGVPVLIAPNFAIGAVLMMEFAKTAARHLTSCEIVELHHEAKIDAPSGTAKRTADLVSAAWEEDGLLKDVPVHSVRLPGLVAHQEVIFGGLGQTLTIRHDSLSRESFMPGVLHAIKRVGSLQGVVVGLENIL